MTTSTGQVQAYRNKYAQSFDRDGIRFTMIGGWQDLGAYYAGSDGNAWYVSGSRMSNCGELAYFKSNFNNRWRGELLVA